MPTVREKKQIYKRTDILRIVYDRVSARKVLGRVDCQRITRTFGIVMVVGHLDQVKNPNSPLRRTPVFCYNVVILTLNEASQPASFPDIGHAIANTALDSPRREVCRSESCTWSHRAPTRLPSVRNTPPQNTARDS